MIGEPPFDAGAAQLSATWPLPRVADNRLGEPGTVAPPPAAGVADSAFEGKLMNEPLFVAVTVKE